LFQEQVQLGGAALNGGSYGSGSSIPPRPSPFSAAATASESLLRDRTQLRGLFSGPSPSPARQHEYSARPHAGTTYAPQAAASSSPHVVLPSAARAPYAQWLTSEIHSVIAENEDRADSMAGSRSRLSTYDDDYDVPTMAQRYPVAAAAAASLHSPMETSLTSASAFSSSFLSSHTGNLAEVLRSGIKDVRLQ
jgi:hypothetical protein